AASLVAASDRTNWGGTGSRPGSVSGSDSPPRPTDSGGRNRGWSHRRPRLLRDRLGSSSSFSSSAERRLDSFAASDPGTGPRAVIRQRRFYSASGRLSSPSYPVTEDGLGVGWALATLISRSPSHWSATVLCGSRAADGRGRLHPVQNTPPSV